MFPDWPSFDSHCLSAPRGRVCPVLPAGIAVARQHKPVEYVAFCFGDASIVPVRGRIDGDFGLEIPIIDGNDRVVGLVYRQARCLEFCGVKRLDANELPAFGGVNKPVNGNHCFFSPSPAWVVLIHLVFR